MKKTLIATVLTVMALGTTACSTVSTEPDQQAIRYSDPVVGAKEFKECFGPSSYDMASPTNASYTYPAGQRVYNFIPDGGDGKTFSVTTKDGITLDVEGSIRFQLTDNCDELRQFHEKIGLKTAAYEDEGWVKFLNDYFRAPINRAITDATQGLEWSKIYSDPATKAEWEKTVSELLPRYVAQTIGGDYITNYEVTLQKPILPEQLEAALRDTQVAVEQEKAQEARNTQVTTELDSIKQLVDVLGPEGYNTYQAIKDGRITILPVPQGTNVTIPTP